jgi:hypothetical protein
MDDHQRLIDRFKDSIVMAYAKHNRQPPPNYNIITVELYQDIRCIIGMDQEKEMRDFVENELTLCLIPELVGMNLEAWYRKNDHMPIEDHVKYYNKTLEQAKKILAPIFAEFKWGILFSHEPSYIYEDLPGEPGPGRYRLVPETTVVVPKILIPH